MQTETEAQFLFSNNGHRLVKKMIQNIKVSTDRNKNALEEAVEKIVKNIEMQFDLYINSKGVFVIIAILENSDFAEKLKQILQRYKTSIDKMPGNSGLAVLKQLIS